MYCNEPCPTHNPAGHKKKCRCLGDPGHLHDHIPDCTQPFVTQDLRDRRILRAGIEVHATTAPEARPSGAV